MTSHFIYILLTISFIFITTSYSAVIYNETASVAAACGCHAMNRRQKAYVYFPETKSCMSFGGELQGTLTGGQLTYRKFSQGAKIPFFGIREKCGLKAQPVFKDGAVNETFFADWGEWTAGTAWYKSPLIDMWNEMKLGNISYAMYTGGNKSCELVFNATGSGSFIATDWFKTEKLVESSPWLLSKIKASTYGYVKGVEPLLSGSWNRNFYFTDGNTCGGEKGLTGIYNINDICIAVPVPPLLRYAYDPATKGMGTWTSQGQLAEEVRMSISINEIVYVAVI